MHYGKHISFSNRVTEVDQMLLFDPQTSGGLLLCVPDIVVTEFIDRAGAMKQPIWEIGRVVPGNSIEVV